MNKKFKLNRVILVTLFIIYIFILLFVIVLKFPIGLAKGTITTWLKGGEITRISPQLIPFKTNIDYIKNIHSFNDWFILNVTCNIIMFMPYGILLPAILKKKDNIGRKVILSGCILSVLIEIFQYITALGVCDIDDVILNTLGIALGFGLYNIAKNIITKLKRSKV